MRGTNSYGNDKLDLTMRNVVYSLKRCEFISTTMLELAQECLSLQAVFTNFVSNSKYKIMIACVLHFTNVLIDFNVGCMHVKLLSIFRHTFS